MKKIIVILTLVLISLVSFGQEEKYVENELIVWLEQGVDASTPVFRGFQL